MLRKCESVLLSRASNTPSVLPLKVGALTSEKKNKQWVKQATACSLQLSFIYDATTWSSHFTLFKANVNGNFNFIISMIEFLMISNKCIRMF